METTSLWQDLRYGLRMLGKNPGLAVFAILTLVLGIGATTTIWSAVDSVLLEPFPCNDANRLATRSVSFPEEASITRFPVPIFLDFKEQNHSFEDIIGLAYADVHYKRSAADQGSPLRSDKRENHAPLTARTAKRLAPPGRAFAFNN